MSGPFSRPFDKWRIEGEGAMSYAKCCAVLIPADTEHLLVVPSTTVISLYVLSLFTLTIGRCYYYPHL